MYRIKIENILESAIREAFKEYPQELERFFPLTIDLCSNEDYGDYSSAIALKISNFLMMDSYSVAETIVNSINHLPPFCQSIKASSNGFINITLDRDAFFYGLRAILYREKGFELPDLGKERKIKLIAADSISTISLDVNDGRRLALFDFLRRILPYAGYNVEVETIIRDSGEILSVFAATVEHYYRELLGDASQLFLMSFRNRTAVETARDVIDEIGAGFLPITRPQRISAVRDEIPSSMSRRMRNIYGAMGFDCGNLHGTRKYSEYVPLIHELEKIFEQQGLLYTEDVIPFEHWICGRQFSDFRKSGDERSKKERFLNEYFYWKSQVSEDGGIQRQTEPADSPRRLIYNFESQVWIRSTAFGDSEDRIFFLPYKEPSDYLLSLAVVLSAIKQGYHKVLVAQTSELALERYHQLSCALKYLDFDDGAFEIIGVDKTSISGMCDDQETHKGDSLDILNVFEQIGKDAMFFAYLQKPPLVGLDIDCNLFKREDSENPLFSIKQAFTRFKSLFKMAASQGYPATSSGIISVMEVKDFKILTDDRELGLLKKVIRYPSVVCDSVTNYDPSILLSFIAEVARDFNDYYTSVKILSGEKTLITARIAVAHAVRTVLGAAMSILSIKQ